MDVGQTRTAIGNGSAGLNGTVGAGIWAHPLCVVLVAVTTGLLHGAPLLMSFAIPVNAFADRAPCARCYAVTVRPSARCCRLEMMA